MYRVPSWIQQPRGYCVWVLVFCSERLGASARVRVLLAWKTHTVVQTGNALCSTVHHLNNAVVANTSRTTAAELILIILFALRQNFSIEMFGGNVALINLLSVCLASIGCQDHRSASLARPHHHCLCSPYYMLFRLILFACFSVVTVQCYYFSLFSRAMWIRKKDKKKKMWLAKPILQTSQAVG